MPLPPAPTKKAGRVPAKAAELAASPATSLAPSPDPSPPPVLAQAATGAARRARPGAEAPARSPAAAARASGSTPALASLLAAPTVAPPAAAEAPPSLAPAGSPSAAQIAPPSTAPAAASPSRSKRSTRPGNKNGNGSPNSKGPTRLFVLDTNVLMHDPSSLFRFEEHDIFLPMIVLEELDGHKKGMSDVARNARQASRTLDALVAQKGADIHHGVPLAASSNREATGLLLFQTEPLSHELPASLPQGKADNQILGVVQALTLKHPLRQVVLVSKDINMRIKARALGLAAEDYQNDKTLDDGELLYPGSLALPHDFWTRQSKTLESWQQGGHTYYRISGPVVDKLAINQFVYFESAGEPALYARVTELRTKQAVLRTLKDYTHLKSSVWGITSRNREQNFALNLLMDPEIDFVTLAGTAGTGKTLMALAAGLTQVLDERRYTEIIMTRATVSVGEDIGFLPGTEEEKMGPWMGALDDNLEFLAKGDGGNAGEWGRAATNDLIRSRVKIKSMNFMRGRTFMNKYVIIDEAQNLTPKQMKTLITRAGPGTKIICMGNLAQIDTPYLTEGSSGLTYAVDRFKGWPHGGHITLARGERSRLADFASEVL
ncbi:PhoH family protein [Serpentinimonas barnesii]|uniref:PhoH family protein n=1 Tax=Serpentinimonas barnesii TaxID=1458427 RepID=UPI0004954356|nr:PhoH family protein [Serpentinimonas barnesii]